MLCLQVLQDISIGLAKRPHRLVVRTSRCGRDNPGSTPGEDIAAWAAIIEGSEKYPGYPCGRAGQGMDSIALLLDRG